MMRMESNEKALTENYYSKFIEDALRDGWYFAGPVWSFTDRDNSLKLRKDVPESNGEMLVWLIDRKAWSTADSEHDVHAWFESGAKSHALDIDKSLYESPHSYADAVSDLVKESNTCDFCGKRAGADNLVRVGFANGSCHECLSEAREKHESHGWDH